MRKCNLFTTVFLSVHDVLVYRLFVNCDPLVEVLLNDLLKHFQRQLSATINK